MYLIYICVYLYIIYAYSCICVGACVFMCLGGGEREFVCTARGNICILYMTRPNEETEALKACHIHTIKCTVRKCVSK